MDIFARSVPRLKLRENSTMQVLVFAILFPLKDKA